MRLSFARTGQKSCGALSVSPELKSALHNASRAGVLAYSGMTVYPDLPGFAQHNFACRDILLRGV